jgi:excisionase family DNA binding protein
MDRNRLMTQIEVCDLLGISAITLWRERKAGRISFRRIGSKVVFLQEDIDEYLERNKRPADAVRIGAGPCR